MTLLSPLQQARIQYLPILPTLLSELETIQPVIQSRDEAVIEEAVKKLFPHIHNNPLIHFEPSHKDSITHPPLTVGVVLSGGQAPGGHNVICGLFDALMKLNPDSRLIGFLDGPKGIIQNRCLPLGEGLLHLYRNQGGFDLIGSGRDKIETPEHFAAAEQTVLTHKLDGLVIIGGDDSNTNAALLAEYFKRKGVLCSVIGVPKTIDGDLKNALIPCSFGFDTACKTYSEFIGNTARDALSAKKYYYFIKLMGRSASHVTLECALQTHPNLALIGEEIANQKKTLNQITQQIADLICKRADKGKDYGLVLIPEGILEFIPEFNALIQELNKLLAKESPHATALDKLSSIREKVEAVNKLLTPTSIECLQAIPEDVQAQLFLERDPHGNLQVSKIESERLFIETVKKELKKRKEEGTYKGKFSAQPLFCGYEGRSGLPSNFDCNYCYALGYTAVLLIEAKATGYIATVRNLHLPVEQWNVMGAPLVPFIHLEERSGKRKPVIQKAFVDLQGVPFKTFSQHRERWILEDDYRNSGPIQFFGPSELSDSITLTLELESNTQ